MLRATKIVGNPLTIVIRFRLKSPGGERSGDFVIISHFSDFSD